MPTDQRRFPRYRVSLPVEVSAGGRMQLCEAVDLSAGGCRIVSVFPIGTGEAVRIRLRAPSVPFEVSGFATVAWTRRDPPYAAGLSFADAFEADVIRFLTALLGPVRLRNG